MPQDTSNVFSASTIKFKESYKTNRFIKTSHTTQCL